MKPSLTESRKRLLRKKLRHVLHQIRATQRAEKSRKITESLVLSQVFLRAKNILVYSALPEEVETREMILKALVLKKNIFLPAVDLKHQDIRIYQVRNYSKDLSRGHFGIQEPKPIKKRLGQAEALDLVIVPGLGFDRNGGRLGRGKGYFDRFLKKAKAAKKIGVAFKEQVVAKIPMTQNDVRMDDVISD